MLLGEFTVEFYANIPERDGDRHWHVCQYLITYGRKENYFQVNKSFTESSVSTAGGEVHKVPFAYSKDNFQKGYFVVQFLTLKITFSTD